MKKILLLGGLVLILFGACAGVVGYFFLQATEEVGAGKAVLSQFLRHTSVGELELAYALLATDTKANVEFEQFKSDLGRPEAFAYREFVKLKTLGWNIQAVTGADTSLEYQGVVTYSSGEPGQLHAWLLNQEGRWHIAEINVQRGVGSNTTRTKNQY